MRTSVPPPFNLAFDGDDGGYTVSFQPTGEWDGRITVSIRGHTMRWDVVEADKADDGGLVLGGMTSGSEALWDDQFWFELRIADIPPKGIYKGGLSMNIKLIGSALFAGLLLSMGSIAPANAQARAQRHYDCSKTGNANKAACKVAAKPAPTRRNYDCTKPGNANKSVCKTAARPAPAPKAAVAASRNYDCTKPGNANKTACKTSAAPAPATHAAKAHAPSAAVSATGPQGATAKCRDNTYSHAANHKGACSHHGGVATYY